MDNEIASNEVCRDERKIAQQIMAEQYARETQTAREEFNILLKSASQPRHASGNACIKLCYYVEQCRKSTSRSLQELAFSKETCFGLFNFYIEWNEKNQHRSMRQVIELLASLITLNPDHSSSSLIKNHFLEKVLSIITHQSAQPFVKPAFKILECFLSKSTVSTNELAEVYGRNAIHSNENKSTSNLKKIEDPNIWHQLVSAIFEWMSLPDTASAVGKVLVTLFQKLKVLSPKHDLSNDESYTILWQRWIRHGLAKHPDSVENIKNYLFPPLFKLDKFGSLEFLQSLVRESQLTGLESQESNAQVFLLLSAMEVGKKSGLVDDTNSQVNGEFKLPKTRDSIIFPEYTIGRLMGHQEGKVRSAAFSVLVSSISSIRPFTLETFKLLRQYLGLLHTDTDAKVRNEVLSNSKRMVGRIKGAILFLIREVASSSVKHNQISPQNSGSFHVGVGKAGVKEAITLQEHEEFLLWYQNFLINELIPTASYQRHITGLRAIQIVIESGVLRPHNEDHSEILAATEPKRRPEEKIFTKRMIRLLMDLLMNPFEDVRAAAHHLLRLAPETCYKQQEPAEASPSWPSAFPTLSQITLDKGSSITTGVIPVETNNLSQSQPAVVLGVLKLFLQRAEMASRRTGRADLADGVARTHELLYYFQATDEARLELVKNLVIDLEDKVYIAEKSLSQAVHVAPVHGYFAALRLVWELSGELHCSNSQLKSHTSGPNKLSWIASKDVPIWIDLQYRMIRCCARIWSAVKDVLCNDSPEGHMLQDIDDLDTIGTKDILSYSFRAIHESSKLLQAIVNKLKLKFADNSTIVPYEIFHAAGTLSFEQLSTLRHRGAFSTVSTTFASCCQLTQESSFSKAQGESLLEEWYQGTLTCIYEQSSTTRRSAGIPALMTGILSANASSPAFEEVMAQLKTLARYSAACTAKDETNLSQVHAMNCLKEIFKSSSLGKRCEDHIADCLQIGAESLRSEIWAIRNCGLLLLRSLIDCLFGTNESKSVTEAGWDGKSTRLAYERYPALPEILLSLMATQNGQLMADASPRVGAVESVFPALDIIRRAGPPQKLRQEIYARLKSHLGSNIWHVRDIAARTFCTLLLDGAWLENLSELLEKSNDSSNELHGILLATKYLLERKIEMNSLKSSESLLRLKTILDRVWGEKFSSRPDPIVEAAYVEVRVVILRIGLLTSSVSLKSDYEEKLFGRASNMLSLGYYLIPNTKAAIDGEPIFPEKSDTLLIRVVTIGALYTSIESAQIGRLQELILSVIQYDIDIACDVLSHLLVVWDLKVGQAEDFARLVDLLIKAYAGTLSNEVRNIVLRILAAILEHLFQSGWLKRTEITFNMFSDFDLPLLLRGNPDLSNASIRISGSLLALEFLEHIERDSTEDLSDQIQAWGNMLGDNASSENDFDTRYAAVTALKAFYSAFNSEMMFATTSWSLVPSLLVLYDSLNDDDDEIREVAAKVVSKILGSNQAPLAASRRLVDWLHRTFGRTEAFRTAVICRIAGYNGQSIDETLYSEAQFAEALKSDDSLFVEEEQNLYVDEVREAIAWTSLLVHPEMIISDEKMIPILSWVLEGVNTLIKLSEREDGPLGWTSKPKVFAKCMRIILAAKAIIALYRQDRNLKEINSTLQDERMIGKPLLDAVQRLLEVGIRTSLHPVLLDILVAKPQVALSRQNM